MWQEELAKCNRDRQQKIIYINMWRPTRTCNLKKYLERNGIRMRRLPKVLQKINHHLHLHQILHFSAFTVNKANYNEMKQTDELFALNKNTNNRFEEQ